MRHPIRLLSLAAMMLALSGCARSWYNGYCDTSDNCAMQPGFGKVCVQGRCQECGLDADCKAGFVCRAQACVPRPECERNSDCAAGKACQAGKCVSGSPPSRPSAEGTPLPTSIGIDRAVVCEPTGSCWQKRRREAVRA